MVSVYQIQGVTQTVGVWAIAEDVLREDFEKLKKAVADLTVFVKDGFRNLCHNKIKEFIQR